MIRPRFHFDEPTGRWRCAFEQSLNTMTLPERIANREIEMTERQQGVHHSTVDIDSVVGSEKLDR